MLEARTHKTVVSLVLAGAVCLAGAGLAQAATPLRMAGAITGFVTDAAGVPQMGAAVVLFNRQERQFERALTDERGAFRFLGLTPDLYSIKVTLAAFVPAMKKGILVQPGMASVLNVNLNTLFSSIQFAYPPIENGSLMSDEWKWVLRSASPTRPVLRFSGDAVALSTDAKAKRRTAVFSDTRGVFKLSAGEGSVASDTGNEADMGTAFALATSLYGNNMLQVSGNVGYGSQTGVPTAAFRTSYSRNLGGESPEVSVTMRQLYLPGRLGAALTGNEGALPMLRTMSASFDDRTELTDQLAVQYGFTMNSISFLDHVNYASPYARVTYSLGDNGELAFAYTSGDARPDLAGKGQHGRGFAARLEHAGNVPADQLAGRAPEDSARREFRVELYAQGGLAHLPALDLPRERHERGAVAGGAGGHVHERRHTAGSVHRNIDVQRRQLSEFGLHRGGDAGTRAST